MTLCSVPGCRNTDPSGLCFGHQLPKALRQSAIAWRRMMADQLGLEMSPLPDEDDETRKQVVDGIAAVAEARLRARGDGALVERLYAPDAKVAIDLAGDGQSVTVRLDDELIDEIPVSELRRGAVAP